MIPSYIDDSWKNLDFSVLEPLRTLVLPKCRFAPDTSNIFRVLRMPLEKVKVVIIGQDPYPKEGDAIGLAFAVPSDRKTPYSLRQITEELVVTSQIGLSDGLRKPLDLTHWESQGVFLLNRALTVEIGNPNSHTKYWEDFTMQVIKELAKSENHIIWLLWGNNAKKAKSAIPQHHFILEHTHPSATRYGHPFKGCGHFREVNNILKTLNTTPISWGKFN